MSEPAVNDTVLSLRGVTRTSTSRATGVISAPPKPWKKN